MKEQRITIEINKDGQISADAEGFTGDVCLHELDRLLDSLSPGIASVERKPDAGATVSRAKTLTAGKKT